MQGAEASARAGRLGEPHDDEVRGVIGTDLQPVPGAHAPVGRVGPLRHDALEAHCLDVLEHGLTPIRDVVREAERTGRGQHPLEQAFPVHEW